MEERFVINQHCHYMPIIIVTRSLLLFFHFFDFDPACYSAFRLYYYCLSDLNLTNYGISMGLMTGTLFQSTLNI